MQPPPKPTSVLRVTKPPSHHSISCSGILEPPPIDLHKPPPTILHKPSSGHPPSWPPPWSSSTSHLQPSSTRSISVGCPSSKLPLLGCPPIVGRTSPQVVKPPVTIGFCCDDRYYSSCPSPSPMGGATGCAVVCPVILRINRVAL
jgi:hypothetical protein